MEDFNLDITIREFEKIKNYDLNSPEGKEVLFQMFKVLLSYNEEFKNFIQKFSTPLLTTLTNNQDTLEKIGEWKENVEERLGSITNTLKIHNDLLNSNQEFINRTC